MPKIPEPDEDGIIHITVTELLDLFRQQADAAAKRLEKFALRCTEAADVQPDTPIGHLHAESLKILGKTIYDEAVSLRGSLDPIDPAEEP